MPDSNARRHGRFATPRTAVLLNRAAKLWQIAQSRAIRSLATADGAATPSPWRQERSLARSSGSRRHFPEVLAMRRSKAPGRPGGRSILDTLFAGGCTAVFLVMMASVAGAVSLYLR
jgi:hypothetical protein